MSLFPKREKAEAYYQRDIAVTMRKKAFVLCSFIACGISKDKYIIIDGCLKIVFPNEPSNFPVIFALCISNSSIWLRQCLSFSACSVETVPNLFCNVPSYTFIIAGERKIENKREKRENPKFL